MPQSTQNDVDVEQQLVFEAGLLGEVRGLFIELLDEIYKSPARNVGVCPELG